MAPKAPAKGSKKQGAKTQKDALVPPKKDSRFEKRPKNFSIGNDLPHAQDMKRFVRWPRYIWRQRRLRILQNRLKIPPAINQFSKTLDPHTRQELMKLCRKYKPESTKARRERHKALAAAKATRKGRETISAIPQKPITLRCGIKCVTRLIERNKAKLVMIASDVNPIELVIYLPALCRKLSIPYCIVRGKALLGQLVGFKTATCVAFDKCLPEDKATLDKLIEAVNVAFNDKYDDFRKESGGLKFGKKATDRRRLKERRAQKNLA
jgi:large subunit ribosomal protein L7Ae